MERVSQVSRASRPHLEGGVEVKVKLEEKLFTRFLKKNVRELQGGASVKAVCRKIYRFEGSSGCLYLFREGSLSPLNA